MYQRGPSDEGGGCRWRVWAPAADGVELLLRGRRLRLLAEPGGYWSAVTERPPHGTHYYYSLGGGEPLPDPCSHWQPGGVFGPSATCDQGPWDEGDWRGVDRAKLVIYELHVGTFTPEGTFDAARARLRDLADLGVTAVELMPVAQFSGRFGWGYDGVFPLAVHDSYGGPAGLQRFVAAAHRAGLAVLLDVVLNHLGPEGNVLPSYGPYLTDRRHTPWGATLDFGLRPVRELALAAAEHWVRRYRLDGIRLDSTHNLFDDDRDHVLGQIARAARRGAVAGRPVHVLAEDDANDADLTLGTYGLDGQWNDEFHHAVQVALTGERTSLFSDYDGLPDLARVLERVFAYDGRFSRFRGRVHGRPVDRDRWDGSRFVAFLQNHDWVGNRPRSDRLSTRLDPEGLKLAAGLLLLTPRLPLLFMGEEYGETRPFPFFCDFDDRQLRRAVRRGRELEVAHLGGCRPPDPCDPATRQLAVLDWQPRGELWRFYRRLLRLRAGLPGLGDLTLGRASLRREVLSLSRGDDLVVTFNFGREPCEPAGSVLFHSGGRGPLRHRQFSVRRAY